MKKGIKLLKIGIALALLGFLFGFSLVRNSNRTVKSEKITIDNQHGNSFINDSTVLNIYNAGVLPLENTKREDLSVSNLEQWVNQNPYVKDVEVYVNLEGEIYASVKQEVPIARIKTPDQEFYLTEEGKSIPLSNHFSAKVILVNGNIQPNEYEDLSRLIHQINEDKLLKKHIIGISKKASKSFILLVSRGGYKITVGDLENTAQKLKKLKIFYQQYMGKVAPNTYSEINLSFKNQIVATKNEHDETQ